MDAYTNNLDRALLKLEKIIEEARKNIPISMTIYRCSTTPTETTFNLRDLNKELINNKQ